MNLGPFVDKQATCYNTSSSHVTNSFCLFTLSPQSLYPTINSIMSSCLTIEAQYRMLVLAMYIFVAIMKYLLDIARSIVTTGNSGLNDKELTSLSYKHIFQSGACRMNNCEIQDLLTPVSAGQKDPWSCLTTVVIRQARYSIHEKLSYSIRNTMFHWAHNS